MLLRNSQILLRAVEPEDLDILYKWENSTALWIHGNTLAPYSKLVLRQYINDTLSMDIFQSKQLRLMIELTDKGTTVGTVDLYEVDAFHRRAGIGILVDENYRRAWLYGDWDVVAGSFFGDLWRKDRHVLAPFKIPSDWYCYRTFDWGSTKPFSVGWWTIADGTKAPDGVYYPRGAIIKFSEWYGCKKDSPNTGLRLTSKEVAKGVKELDAKFAKEYGIKINPGPADPAIYASDDGPSIAENMKSVGVTWVPADNSRLAGWEQMRERLKGTEDDKPLLYVFNTCLDLIRTLPGAPRDEAIWDDIDTEYEDHALDEARYACMFRKREFGGFDMYGGKR